MIDLLCLPCAGASAMMYLRWGRLLPSWVRLIPVELPGRGARSDEPYAADFDALVAQLCRELPSGRHDGPGPGAYALFGHSMGALVAHGITERLRLLGAPLPTHLFVSASAAPSRRDSKRFADKQGDDVLIAELGARGGTPDAVFASPDLLRITLDALAADYRVCASHVHRQVEPLPVPVHVWGGQDDDITADELSAWGEVTRAAFSLEWFTGGHFFIRQHEASLLQGIVGRLAMTFESRFAHDAA